MHSSLVEARHLLRRAMPFLSHALWSLSFVEVPGLFEMALAESGGAYTAYISCDKYWRVYYDPEVIKGVPIQVLAFDLYHELCHLLHKHNERCEKLKLDRNLYNVASDMSINGDAVDIEISTKGLVRMPETVILPEHYKLPNGKSAEWYYEQLMEKLESNQGTSRDGEEKGQDGGGSKENHKPGQDLSSSKKGEGGGPEGAGDTSTGHRHQRCGGCAGTPNPWENNESPGENGNIPRGITPAEAKIIAVQVAYAAKRQGNAPAGWKRWADEILEPPKVNPHELFKRTVMSRLGQVAGKLDYTYAYPSRRQFCVPQVVLPGMHAPQVRLAVVIDTSGSIGDKELGLEIAFLREVVKQVFVHETYVYSCDYAANLAGKVFSSHDIHRLDIRGGGGTSMRNGVLKAMECKPSLIIVLTDGYTDWPKPHELKGTPVIWGLIGPNPPRPPQGLGDVIILTAEEKAA